MSKPTVCDNCLTAAYDEGIEDYDEQVLVMLEIGADMPDHLCDVTEERGEPIVCFCPCKPGQKGPDGKLGPELRQAA